MRILFILISTVIFLFGCNKSTEEESIETSTIDQKPIKITQTEKPNKNKSVTSGISLDDIKVQGHSFISTVENSPSARPHSGLIYADIVYEMEVEYNVTRFLALFNDFLPEKVGPVRSARHYFLPIIESWETNFFHYGASKYAYEEFDEYNITNYDGTKSGHKYYLRDNTRKAPHNAYLITDTAPKGDYIVENHSFIIGRNQLDETLPYTEVDKINIRYYSANDVSYIFDEDTEKYKRYINDREHADRESEKQILVKNIIVLYATHEDLKTKQKHINIDLESGGDLDYFVNGKKYKGTWISTNGNLKFLDLNGKKLNLLEGNTWIQIVDQDRKEEMVNEQ